MHEQGYTFVGANSLYRLLIPEMRVLYAGYRVTKQQEQDRAQGVEPKDRGNLSQFAQERETGEWADKHGVKTSA